MSAWEPTIYDSLKDATHEIVEGYKRAATTPAYEERFLAATSGLALEAIYGLGPHSLPAVEDALEVARPRTVLEIGFGAGASSAMFLDLDATLSVVSVDNTRDDRCLAGARLLRERYGARFTFLNVDSRLVDMKMLGPFAKFDLAFIDGGHDLASVRSDLRLAASAGVKHILLDDWWPYLGPGVQEAVKERDDLVPLRQWGNLMLMQRKRGMVS